MNRFPTWWIWAGVQCDTTHGQVGGANSEAGLAAGGEATLKACGVGVAMLPEQSWAPQ